MTTCLSHFDDWSSWPNRDRFKNLRVKVSSYNLEQLAQEAVRNISSISRIANRLEVVYVQ